jgi:hypothetical protein
MAILSAIGMGLGVVNSGLQFLEGSKIKSQANHGLAKFQHQELTNLAENLKPSLEAERQMQTAASKQRAAVVDVAGGMDAAQAMAMTSAGLGATGDLEMKAFSSILDKEYQADVSRVQEEQTMRSMVEKRKMEELSSLRAQKMAGMQMQTSAMKDLGGMALGAGLASDKLAASQGKATSLFGKAGATGTGINPITGKPY